ncbi:serine hydrolase [Parapedobacter sp. 10938]|uniref:serine hydrolase n=1 Tax=Parapedobacter flavus TaxID=3110225 RepID=UPI002DBF5979|nr:serine hydrolase [Parapedobacter sp. 10938]MEC3880047.1 serine hydrolase [Parapedobacter sp. 10938]
MKYTLFSVVFGVLLGASALAQPAGVPPDLDAYVERILREFDVPGLGLGIVKDGEVVLAKGYGIKRLGYPDKIDENTLFSIASNSKAFTATALGMLVEEGKLKWEDRVTKYLPWFALSDSYVTHHLTVRDLLVHHSGLPAYVNDMLLFPPANLTRKKLLLKLKDVPLAYDFRSVYAYDNILYLAAGEVVEAVSGMSWEDFVKQRIFDKVGMVHSISRFSELRQQPNVAYSHARRGGKVKVIEQFFDSNIGDPGNPAGGIAASAADMANWLVTQLDSGRTPEKGRLFGPQTTKELWKVVRPMPISKEPAWLKPAQKHFYGYALGFRTYDYRGEQVVGHGGALTGFVSQIAMLPEQGLGVVVLTNQSVSSAYWALIHHILDHYLGAEPFDWLAGYKKGVDRSLARQDSVRRAEEPVVADATMKPALPLEAYVGVYHDDFIGRIVVGHQGDTALRLDFVRSPQYSGTLLPFHGDLFRLVTDNPERDGDAYLTFLLNADKSIREGRFVAERSTDRTSLSRIVLRPDKDAILDTTALRKRIHKELDKYPEGRFAYAFMDVESGQQVLFHGNESFHAASTMKTPVMIEAFKQAKQGKFALTDSITVYNTFRSIVDKSRYALSPESDSEQALYAEVGDNVSWNDLLYRMITESSNLATNIVIDQVGAKNVMKTMKSIGANDIRVLRGVEDIKAYEKGLNNTTTAYDLMLIFEQLATGGVVSDDACKQMLAILMDQHHRGIIPAKLPDDVKVANKTGSITHILHDSGIVYLPDGRRYVLVLLSGGLEEGKAKAALSSVSKLFYDYMDGKR